DKPNAELVDAPADGVCLRVSQRGDRHPQRRMDHAPDDECRDAEDQRRDVIEVDRPLVTDGVAELKSAYRDKPVTSAADEPRSSHGEDSRELMEGQREEDDIDASQAKRRQADAQRRKHRDDRREEDREERIPAEAVDEESGPPTADGEQ